MSSRNAIVVANVIKFGIPFGIVLGVSHVVFEAIFRDGVSPEAIAKSFMMLAMSILGGIVLGLSRARSA